MSDPEYLFVYERELAYFLRDKGFKYITHAIHPKTRNDFFLYLKTPSVKDSIREYKKLPFCNRWESKGEG